MGRRVMVHNNCLGKGIHVDLKKKRSSKIFLLLICFFVLHGIYAECALAQKSFGQWSAQVDKILEELQPALSSWPPKISSKEELERLEVRWYDAEVELKKFVSAYPDEPAARWRIGELYRLGHNLNISGCGHKCVTELNKAILLNPVYLDAYMTLGYFYVGANIRWAPEAEKCFLKAIEISGDKPLPKAWSGLFLAYYKQGRFSEASTAADKYLSMEPEDNTMKKMSRIAKMKARKN